MSRAHRVAQVAAHLAAVARESLLPFGAAPAGAAGARRLVELGASEATLHLFAAAHPADRAAATRLAARLRTIGANRDEELAALLHDVAKGRCGLVARIIHVLEGSPTSGTPRGPRSSDRALLRAHATRAAHLARQVGAPEGCVQILAELALIERGEGDRGASGDVPSSTIAARQSYAAARRLAALDSGGAFG